MGYVKMPAKEKDSMEFKQAQYHFDEECIRILDDCEKRYTFDDETAVFADLVNFSTAKTQPYQRWVRYREGYSTVLVQELMKRAGIDAGKEFVADPMMGSGSTLIAAKEKGYDSFGMDVNPYCRLMVDLKMANPAGEHLKRIKDLVSRKGWNGCEPDEEEWPLSDYFPADNLKVILKIRKWLESLPEGFPRDALKAAWFFCLENSSNRKKDGNGLATRPAPITNVEEYYTGMVMDIVHDFETYPIDDKKSWIKTESAFQFAGCINEFETAIGKKLGCVIFSPPYANSFDYFESYKLELLFGKLIEQEKFNEYKKKLIRNFRICKKQDIDCDIDIAEAFCREIWQQILKKEKMTGKRDERTRLMPNMIRGYFIDMRRVLEQIYEALSKDKYCYIVVDQSAYVGVIIPTDVVLALLAERIGFTVEKISVCRRASTSGQQLKRYPYLKNALRESILCLKR